MKKKMTMARASSRFLKPIIETLQASMSKAKACASTIKVLFSLLGRKKLLMVMSSVSRKLQLPVQGQEEQQQSEDVVVFQAGREGGPRFRFRDWWPGSGKAGTAQDDGDDEDDYDVRFQLHDLMKTPGFEGSGCIELDEEEEGVVNGGSAVQAAMSSRVEAGEEFRLEDEIDRVADLVIRRFYLQQRMQRQISLKSKRESN